MPINVSHFQAKGAQAGGAGEDEGTMVQYRVVTGEERASVYYGLLGGRRYRVKKIGTENEENATRSNKILRRCARRVAYRTARPHQVDYYGTATHIPQVANVTL